MSIDNALRLNTTSPQLDPQTAPTTAPTTDSSQRVTSPLAPSSSPVDVGAGLAAMALGTPDTAATAGPVQTAAVTEAAEKAIMHQVDRQVAGGIQALRDLAQAASPSSAQVLAQMTECYTAATELATLSEIDAEVPSVVSHALLKNDAAVTQLGSDNATELAEVCKDKISQLFNAVNSHDVEEAQAFLTGLRDQLKASNALDDGGAALLRSMTHLAASKMEDIASGYMADIGDDFGLADAENILEEAKSNLAEARGNFELHTQEREDLLPVNIANLFNENIDGDISDANHRMQWSSDQVQAMQKNVETASREVSEAQVQTFAALAGRSEIRMQDEVNTILGDELTALSQGEGSMTLGEMSQRIDESPLLTDSMRVECQRSVEAFSQATLSTLDEKLTNDVKDLHISTGEGGRPIIQAGNLEARASQLRQDIMATTLAGHGQEEALAKLDAVMTGLSTERADGLKQIFANHEGGALNNSQCATLNTLLKFEGVAYDPMALEQIGHFGQGLGAQLDSISQGLDANATTAQKLDAAHSVDMVFMDNPLMGDTALAMKESILGEGHEALPTMHARHEAVCAKSEAFAAVGSTKAFSTALDGIGKEAGCDKHHAAAVSMRDLFANGLGSTSKVQAASVMLLHAAWTEQKADLVDEHLDEDALDAQFKNFVDDLPPKLQHTLAKGHTDIALLEGACTAGITNKAQYAAATRSIAQAAAVFTGKRASTALQTIAGTLATGQARMAEDRLFLLIVDGVEAARNEAIAHDHVERDDSNSTMAALRTRMGETEFGTKITDTGGLKTLGGAYIDALDTLQEEAYNTSHNELIQDVMKAQGVSDIKKVRGETLAVSCQYIDRVLTESVHDLSNSELARVGLSRIDLGDMGALDLAIKHTDWGNVDSGFATATVLHALYTDDCASKNTEASQQGFVAFAAQKGVPNSFNEELKRTYGILTASVEDRQNAIKGLSLHPSHTRAVGNRHVDFEQMKISTSVVRHSTDVHAKDSPEKAHSREFTRLLNEYTSHTGADNNLTAMKDQMKYIIDTYRPKMDAVLALRDSGNPSVADHMQRLDEKVFSSKPNMGTDFHTAVRGAVRSETMGLLNAGQNLRVINKQMDGLLATKTGMHSSFDSNKRGLRGAILRKFSGIADRIRVRTITNAPSAQTAAMGVLQTSLLRAFQDSGAKSFDAFGQLYEKQLQEAHGAIGQTDICKTMTQELVAFGMKEDVAGVRARGLLVGMKGAMPRLLKATVAQVDAKNLEKQLQLASNGTRTKLEVRESLCADASNRVLENLGTGDAVAISSSLKVTLTLGGKVKDLVAVTGNYSNELKDSLIVTRSGDGRPEISLSNEAVTSFALSGSFAGLTAKGTVTGLGANGMRLTFKDNADCANFMTSLFSGGGKPEDLAYLDEVHFLTESGIGAGILLKEDIIGTISATTGVSIPKARLEGMATAQGSVSVSHESHRHGETTRLKTNYQLGATAAVGFGGGKEAQIRAKRSLASTMNVGPNIRMAGRDRSLHGLRVQRQYAAENTLEVDYAKSRGKTLNGDNVRVMKGARKHSTASFRASDGNSQSLAADFMKKNNVPASAQKEVAAWLAANKPGMFTVVVSKDIKQSAIAHKSEVGAMAALAHDSNFTFGGVTIKTNKMEFNSKRYIPIKGLTLRASVEGSSAKAVKFMGNAGKEAQANAVPKDTIVDNIQQPLDPHADMDRADLVAEQLDNA